MLKEIILLGFVAWIVISSLMEGREKNKAAMLVEMKGFYSARQVVELLYSFKSEAMYLAYGAVVRFGFAAITIKP